MLRRSIAIPFVVVLVTVACTESGVQAVDPQGASARVVYVFDGDSMEVDVDGQIEEVRLLGINAPEGDECYGNRARDALIDMVDDQDLVLVETSGVDVDRYDRLLRYVYVDGDSVNESMLAGGHAVTLQGDHRHNDEFFEIGNVATEAILGMWAPDACGPPPRIGATIAAVMHDPPGPDDERLNDEYVTIANESTMPLNLAGWTLRDESSQNRYVFGDLTLRPGMSVTVRSGCGEDRPATVYWCSERSIWSNGGDTAIIQDRYGNVADRRTYTGDK